MNGVEIVTTWLTPTVLFCLLNLMIGTIFFISSLKPNTKRINLGDNNKDEHRPQLGRVPSFFERVKSINLSRYQPEQPDQAHYAVPAEQQAAHQQEPEYEGEEPHHVARTKSDAVTKVKPAARVLKKSASEKVLAAAKKREEEEEEVDQRRPATVREKATASGGEDEAVDEKADDFINRFRQQLKLQRLDSILRYKEMLNRGTGR
ncbi:hypothetical protein DH2020_026635 [Rehmannia glutinosa]|uniref:DUF4408 domain-containing protein n=1 Tax=Rehmannia glutinosa TaxID=99300 RepID=A0ABR0VYT8_REHGL